MKKILSVIVIILVCALSVAALTGVLRSVKNDRDDPSESTSIISEESTVISGPTVSGVYYLKSDYVSFSPVDQEVNFTYNGEQYSRIYRYETEGGAPSIRFDDLEFYTNSGLTHPEVLSLDFGTESQAVSEEFSTWLNENFEQRS